MKSSKRYSNVTITKRVDHDAGRHRTARAPAEPAQCRVCGAVYSKRRWTLPGTSKKVDKHNQWRPVNLTICPACRKRKEGLVAGFVYLDGSFLVDHREEIERLLLNEAERAAVDNPLARIIGWETGKKGRLEVATSTEHLAERLGQSLHRAFRGQVRYDFSHENKLARVYWHRD